MTLLLIVIHLFSFAFAAPTDEMIGRIRDFRRGDKLISPHGRCEEVLLNASEILGRPLTHAEIEESLDGILTEVNERLQLDWSRVPACFTAAMRVDTPRGPRPIADLLVGDVVFSYDLKTGLLVPNVVEKFQVTRARPYATLIDLARPLEVTARHRVLSGAGCGEDDFRAVGDLDPRDPLYAYDLRGTAGVGLKRVPRGEYRPAPVPADVYEILLKGSPHNYFVEGVLVHNGIKVTI
jgi:hypothetical protein